MACYLNRSGSNPDETLRRSLWARCVQPGPYGDLFSFWRLTLLAPLKTTSLWAVRVQSGRGETWRTIFAQ
eukprot:2088078-Pyramimonas_sp.AAC.1